MTGMLTLSNLLAWSAQVSLLVAVAFGAMALLRVEVPALRHAFLRTVLAICLLLPLVQPVRSSTVAPGAGVTTSDAAFVPLGATATVPARRSPAELFDAYVPPAVAVVIVTGIIARFAWMAAGIHRLRRLRRVGVLAVDRSYDDLQRTIGTKATIRWVVGLGQPVTFGFRSPIVLLPPSLADQPADIQRAVVAHELWHVRRSDWLWTVIEEAIRAVFWWHPAIWILLSRIQGTREEVVDRLAILATGSRRTYVDALLTYAGESPLCGSTAFGRRRHLVHRLVLISKEAVMSARRVVACGAVLAVVTACSGWYAVQAFPMMQVMGPLAGEEILSETPGPVERRAKPVTPENPIPRRTWHVPADYPAEAAALNWSGMSVTLRVSLDEAGTVAETRFMRISVSMTPSAGMPVATPGAPARIVIEGRGRPGLEWAVQRAPQELRDATRHALLAAMQSAATAVKQWRYDPPADGPISFSVVVPVGPEADTTAAAQAQAVSRPSAAPPAGVRTEDVTVTATRDRPGFEPSQHRLEPDGAVRVGGNIKAPTKVRHVNPMYPPDAQDARVSGVVILECRIEPDGTVSDVRVLRSIPMLDEAAIGAVQQWEFTPTLMNGVPVPVVMTVTVNFTLQ